MYYFPTGQARLIPFADVKRIEVRELAWYERKTWGQAFSPYWWPMMGGGCPVWKWKRLQREAEAEAGEGEKRSKVPIWARGVMSDARAIIVYAEDSKFPVALVPAHLDIEEAAKLLRKAVETGKTSAPPSS
jgi:hypothetical protein